jgi:phosphatidylglycerophosphate synthase
LPTPYVIPREHADHFEVELVPNRPGAVALIVPVAAFIDLIWSWTAIAYARTNGEPDIGCYGAVVEQQRWRDIIDGWEMIDAPMTLLPASWKNVMTAAAAVVTWLTILTLATREDPGHPSATLILYAGC